MEKYTFPKGFLWGAATSSHQVEGGNKNDWTEWEDAGRVRNKEKSGKAADHWNRYKEDFALLKTLNLGLYRFSIEWSRIEPERGKFDQAAIDHYREMLKTLKRKKMKTMVTLHHFTNPTWLPLWTEKENQAHYIRYLEHVVAELGEHVDYWCTINEPKVFALLSYGADLWPPGANNFFKARKVMKNMAETNNRAYRNIHRIYKERGWDTPKVGVAANLAYFTPNTANPLNKLMTRVARKYSNHQFLDQIAGHMDYIGLNYYFTFHVKWYSFKSFTDISYPKLDLPKNDMGWNMEPSGVQQVLNEIEPYGVPIIVTENGVPDAKDSFRAAFIVGMLKGIHGAIKDGVPVEGYSHWSLIDNFEWADGYHGRFGLVEVDFKTQKRTIRDSAKQYAKITKANKIPKDLQELSL